MDGLTKAQLEAIDKIGRRRKAGAKIGPGAGRVSMRMFRTLERRGLVMWQSEDHHLAMLTYPGERVWAKLHPTSRYAVRIDGGQPRQK